MLVDKGNSSSEDGVECGGWMRTFTNKKKIERAELFSSEKIPAIRKTSILVPSFFLSISFFVLCDEQVSGRKGGIFFFFSFLVLCGKHSLADADGVLNSLLW